MGGGKTGPAGYSSSDEEGETAFGGVGGDVTAHSSESDPELVKVSIKDSRSKDTTTSSLVYAKSKVYIHPSSYSRDNVPGWITVTKRAKRDFLLSWIPESLVRDEQKESFIRVELGDSDGNVSMQAEDLSATIASLSLQDTSHAFSLPLSSIYSIVVTPPTLANWYGNIVIHPSEDHDAATQHVNQPEYPLYFHDDESPSTMLMMDRRAAVLGQHAQTGNGRLPSSWGGEDLITVLKKYSNVVRSSLQPSFYLINPSQADLEAHSVPLFEDELPSAAAIQQYRQRQSQGGPSSSDAGRTSILHQSLSPHASTSNSDATPSMDSLTFSVLSNFSRLTNRAKSTAVSIAHPILSHPLSKPILKHLPPPIASLANANSPEYSKWAEKAGVAGYDAARVYLARWAQVVAEEGEKARRSEMRFSGGGLDTSGDSGDEVGGAFEVLATTYRIPRPRTSRVQGVQPIIESEWKAWFDNDGKLMLSSEEAKKRIFQRGLVEGARRQAWPFLLNVYPWDSTSADRTEIYQQRQRSYKKLKAQWYGKEEVTSTEQFVDEHHRIHIDCLRTDRTQPMFAADSSAAVPSSAPPESLQTGSMAASAINASLRGADSGGHSQSNYHISKMVEILLTYNVHETELGYVQGMSDLCSPLYVVLEGDESLVFWCFVNLMEQRMKPNFYRDQSGMKEQLSILQELIALMDPQLYRHLEKTDSLNLFFCFRWVLIAFKREFSFEDVLCIWETLWSAPSMRFHLFLAMSILEAHRNVILRYLQEFDEVLKYINELSQTMEPQPLLSQAEVLYLGFKNLVEVSDRRRLERESIAGESSSDNVRQRKGEQVKKGKETDLLAKLVKEEVDAEASVPLLNVSEGLRNLL